MKIYCGIDWAEAHHDVAVVEDAGTRLAKARITDDLAGFTALCQLLTDTVAVGAPDERTEDELTEAGGFVPVDVAIETDRRLLVAALRAAVVSRRGVRRVGSPGSPTMDEPRCTTSTTTCSRPASRSASAPRSAEDPREVGPVGGERPS